MIALGLTLAATVQGGTAQRQEVLSDAFDLRSADGVGYRIFTAKPAGIAAGERLPVVYLLDGNVTFPIAEKLMATNPSMRAILVGIGYPTQDRDEVVRLRYFDLTPPTPADRIPLAPGMPLPETGGRDAFFRFVKGTVKPEIERRLPVDTGGQALFGHSLGGLFVLHTLFSAPGTFQTYIAADPSIWWNARSILDEQAAFLRQGFGEAGGTRLMIVTGGKQMSRPGIDAEAARRLKELRSGPTGRAIHDALQAVPGLERRYQNYPEESHGSMIPRAVGDALRFALED